MGHDEARPSLHELEEGRLQALLGSRVHGACRLVKDQEPGIGNQGAGEADELPLPLGEAGSPLAHQRVVSSRQAPDHLIGPQSLRDRLHLFPRSFRPSIAEVLEDRLAKEEVLLEHDPHLPMERLESVMADVKAIHQNPPPLRLVKARQEVDDRALSGAGWPDEGHHLPRLHVEAHFPQHPRRALLLAVAERDAVELDMSGDFRQFRGAHPVFHLRLGVEKLEDPLRRRASVEDLVEERAELENRPKEHAEVKHEGGEDAHLDLARCHQMASVDDDGRGRCNVQRPDERRVEVPNQGSVPHVLRVPARKARVKTEVVLLSRESLGDLDAGNALRHIGGEHRQRFSAPAVSDDPLSAEGLRGDQERRNEPGDHQAELPAVASHARPRKQKVKRAIQDGEGAPNHGVLHGGHVPIDPGNDLPGLGPVEIAHREELDMAKNGAPQVIEDPLAHPHVEAKLDEVEEPADEVKRDQGSAQEKKLKVIPRWYSMIHGALHDVRTDHAGADEEELKRHHAREKAPVRANEGQDAPDELSAGWHHGQLFFQVDMPNHVATPVELAVTWTCRE